MSSRITGKERDSETGLDYFGARYFSEAQGRFSSPDPKQFSKRTIENPQKWNKYAYVLNNPLALFGPDGQKELRVTIRAFIPDAKVKVPILGFIQKGDGRSFSTAPNVSSRAQATLSPSKRTRPKSAQPLVGKPSFSTSGSTLDVYGLFTASGNANVAGNVAMNTRLSDGWFHCP
jgi:RHS repeat-associated protein